MPLKETRRLCSEALLEGTLCDCAAGSICCSNSGVGAKNSLEPMSDASDLLAAMVGALSMSLKEGAFTDGTFMLLAAC